MINETTYWITLAHLPKWNYAKINNLIVKFFHEEKISIEDFFNVSPARWKSDYNLEEQDVADLVHAQSELANNAFLAEDLMNQGYELIPITSIEYSKNLKQNLKTNNAPPLLYVKGNKHLLQEQSLAIVGSRNAQEVSLQFADTIAKKGCEEQKVIISGFAKGVDKQALDSAIKYHGKSIIVLPQGITTFSSGFKAYYKPIVEGNVLVISSFHPKAGWCAGLAMARNPIIYGLADQIFVAESNDKGGTWSGVIDGLRKNRTIYVRFPDVNEKNANKLLIQKGAIGVDLEGNMIQKLNYPTVSDLPTKELIAAEKNFPEQPTLFD